MQDLLVLYNNMVKDTRAVYISDLLTANKHHFLFFYCFCLLLAVLFAFLLYGVCFPFVRFGYNILEKYYINKALLTRINMNTDVLR